MNPDRKRKVRLVVALTLAVLLASALVYTSFAASQPVITPSQLVASGQAGTAYQLSGVVVNGSVRHIGSVLDFSVADRAGGRVAVPISYTGAVPDPFREGREIIVTVRKQGSDYVGESGSLITKCPSKYSTSPTAQPS